MKKKFLTIKKDKLIKKKEFIVVVFDQDYKTFVINKVVFNISFDLDIEIYFLKKAQIAYLKIDKALIKIFNKYANFIDIFS